MPKANNNTRDKEELELDDNLEDREDRGDTVSDIDDDYDDDDQDNWNDSDGQEDSDHDEEDSEDTEDDDSAGTSPVDDDYEEEEEDTRGNSKSSSQHRIPKDRFDDVIAQREDAKAQAKYLQDQMDKLLDYIAKREGKDTKPVEKEEEEFVFDFETKEAEFSEAVIAGESKEAARIMKEIRAAERKLASIEASKLSKKAEDAAKREAAQIREEAQFNKVIEINEAKYNFLVRNHPDYNAEAVGKINSLFERFTKSGQSQAEALQDAVDLVAPTYVRKSKSKDNGTDKGIGGKARRSVEDSRRRNARANNAQPPKTRGKSARERSIDEYDISAMSEKDFNSLPADIKRKLRGD